MTARKNVIVTGASKGVGKEICLLLAANNYNVIAVSRNTSKLKEIESLNIKTYSLDLTDFDSIKIFWERYKDLPLDLLVNNAGGGSGHGYIQDERTEGFLHSYKLNVVGPMFLSQLFTPNLKKTNNSSIVFISSLGGKHPYPGGGNYSVAKRALTGLIELMRMEYIQKNIKIIEICPGAIDTIEEEPREFALKPYDIAEAVRWVATLPPHVNINYMEVTHTHNGKH